MAASYEKRGFVMNPRFGLTYPLKSQHLSMFYVSYYYVIGTFSF